MAKIRTIIGIMMVGMLLGGCGGGTTTSVEDRIEENVVTKQGELSAKVGSEYILKTSDGLVNITSTKTNLDDYLKKSIKVTGMFSGSTLYVDKLEEIK